jgi:hypothetical protein
MAFPMRQPGYEVDVSGSWSAPEEKDSAMRWVNALRDKLQPLSHGLFLVVAFFPPHFLFSIPHCLAFTRAWRRKPRSLPDDKHNRKRLFEFQCQLPAFD